MMSEALQDETDNGFTERQREVLDVVLGLMVEEGWHNPCPRSA